MAENNLDNILKNRVSWLADSGPEDDIAISTRIRLARNLKGSPFPGNSNKDELLQTMAAIEMAVKNSKCIKSLMLFQMEKMNDLDRQVLLERRLISKEFSEKKPGTELAVSKDESIAVMINEEDHLRIQTMDPGYQLKEVLKKIESVDDKLNRELPFAFDKELGFLTSCPTNVGTGIRASVMLHLPGLVLSGQINSVVQAVSKLGMAVRGIFGEGSDNLGNLFQVSNQSTLGESEEQIVDRLDTVIRQVISHEKDSRDNLLEKDQNFLLDHVGRAYGTLRHAYIISSKETLNSLSALRIGVDMGMFSSIDIHTVNELFIIIQPAHLQKYAGKNINSEERDIVRATLVRERLKTIENNT